MSSKYATKATGSLTINPVRFLLPMTIDSRNAKLPAETLSPRQNLEKNPPGYWEDDSSPPDSKLEVPVISSVIDQGEHVVLSIGNLEGAVIQPRRHNGSSWQIHRPSPLRIWRQHNGPPNKFRGFTRNRERMPNSFDHLWVEDGAQPFRDRGFRRGFRRNERMAHWIFSGFTGTVWSRRITFKVRTGSMRTIGESWHRRSKKGTVLPPFFAGLPRLRVRHVDFSNALVRWQLSVHVPGVKPCRMVKEPVALRHEVIPDSTGFLPRIPPTRDGVA